MMKNKNLCSKIIGEHLEEHKNIKHMIVNYIDDTQHVVSTKNHTEINQYSKQLHVMLFFYYRYNSLVINASKTEYMHLDWQIKEDDYIITDDKGIVIKPKKLMKVLGININKDNNLRSHLNFMNAKLTMTFNAIKDAIPHKTFANRKVILNSKLRGQITM